MLNYSNLDFVFTDSPLKDRMHKLEIARSADLRYAIHNDMTAVFYRDIDFRLLGRIHIPNKPTQEIKKNYNIYIEGEQGSGKSTVGRKIKCYSDRLTAALAGIGDICFDRIEFIERVKKSKKYETIINDDDYSYKTQVGSTRIAEQYEYIEQAIRAEQTNIINCSVAVTPHLYNYKLRAFDVNYQYGINRVIVYDNFQYAQGRAVGVIFLTNEYVNPQIEKDYAIKKAEFTKKVKEAKNRNAYGELEIKAKLILEKYGNTGRKLKRAIITMLCRKEFNELGESELMVLNDMIYNAQEYNKIITESENFKKPNL